MGLRPPALALCALVVLACLLAGGAGAGQRPRPQPHRHRHRPRSQPSTPATPHVAVANVPDENGKAGTPGWLGPETFARGAEVYASATDAVAGDHVQLHVSAVPAAPYRVLVYRLGWYGGTGAREVACLPSCEGAREGAELPVPPPDADGRVVAGWPVTDVLDIQPTWASGLYLIRVLLLSGPQSGASASTYLVVRDRDPVPTHMLVQVPVNTWEAYNMWGGMSLYPFAVDGRRATRVSFDRPFDWHGRGGQGPLGWELPLLRFIEREGYDVSYQSDVYTDAHPESLLGHRVVVSAGHDEYWSARMRDGWDAAEQGGVNLAFLGANDSYWQVVMQDGGRTIMSYKGPEDPNPDPRAKTTLFRALTPERRECDLMGIQHQGGPLDWSDGGYTVTQAALDDPWFRHTNLHPGDVLPGIVSREVDTIPGGMSADYSCGNRLTILFHRELGGDGHGNADAVRFTTPAGSSVFAAGSLNFAWGLDDAAADPAMGHGYADARLQTFMDNAFASMGAY